LVISAPAPLSSCPAGIVSPPTGGTRADGALADGIRADWLRATAIAFIDRTVPDWPVLMAGLRPGVVAIALDPNRDGIAQISAWLAWRSQTSTMPLREIHLFCHGVPGALLLGDRILNRDTLPHYRWQLRQWFDGHEGSLLLYGCQVALGDRGLGFVQQLRALTGATVAASARRTGCATVGGDWHLEVRLGDGAIAPAVLPEVQATYRGVLATFTVTSTASTGHPPVGQETLWSAIVKANKTPEPDTIEFAPSFHTSEQPIVIKAPPTATGFYIQGDLTIEGPGRNKLHLVGPGIDKLQQQTQPQQQTTVFTISDQPYLDTIWTENNWRLGPKDSKFLPFIIPVPNRQVNISGLTVKGGNLFGGIFSTENLTLTDVGVVENTINVDSSLKIKVGYPEQQLYFSPGVTAINGELRIRDSYIAENRGENTRGGGIAAYTVGRNLSAVPIQNTAIDQTDAGVGGQVFTGKQNVIIENSTIAGNAVTAKTDTDTNTNTGAIVSDKGVPHPQNVVTGGGIWSEADNTFIRNSTIVNNTAAFGGGGIAGSGQRKGEGFGNLFVYNSTVTGNEAQHSQGRGGGIYGEALVQNTIVAGNAAATDGVATGRLPEAAPDVAGGFLAVDIGEPEPLLVPGGIDLGVKSDDRAGDDDREGFNIVGNVGQLSPYDVKGNGLYPVVRSDGELLMIAIPQSEFLSNAFFGAADGDWVGTADRPLALEDIVGELPADGELLRDNGGRTPTVKLTGEGVAIDGGNPNFEPPPNLDQVGRDRVVGGRVDVGPYEFVPTQFVVNTDQDVVDPDDGVVSLREAISAANANPGPDKIIFDTSKSSPFGKNQSVQLTLTQGHINITDDLTLLGLGAEKLAISGNNQSRIFQIVPIKPEGDQKEQIFVTIDGVSIVDGFTDSFAKKGQSGIDGNGGGGILNFGNLSLLNSHVKNNETYGAGGGGGILSLGTVLTYKSEISNNTANIGYEELYYSSVPSGEDPTVLLGGGLSGHRIMLLDSSVSNNKAQKEDNQTSNVFAGGIGLGSITSRIYSAGPGYIVIADSEISQNTADGASAIGVNNGKLSISSSSIIENSNNGAQQGSRDGSIYATGSGTFFLTNSLVSNNIGNGITGDSKLGGLADQTSVTINNSTIANNSGYGIRFENDFHVKNSTIANNLSSGIFQSQAEEIYLENSIVFGNGDDVDGTINGNKTNLIGNISGRTGGTLGTGSDIVGENPLLGELGDYGGPTQTYSLLPDSPAIDKGYIPFDPNVRQPILDQRGGWRTDAFGQSLTGPADIGAFEVGAKFFNLPPIAFDDIASADLENTFPGAGRRLGAERLFVDNVLTNDYDRDGDTLAVCSVNGSADNLGQPVSSLNGGLGLLTVQADGSFIFDPNGDFAFLDNGEDQEAIFSYTLSDLDADGNAKSCAAEAQIIFRIDGENDAPTDIQIAAIRPALNHSQSDAILNVYSNGTLPSGTLPSDTVQNLGNVTVQDPECRFINGKLTCNTPTEVLNDDRFQIVNNTLQQTQTINITQEPVVNLLIRATDQGNPPLQRTETFTLIFTDPAKPGDRNQPPTTALDTRITLAEDTTHTFSLADFTRSHATQTNAYNDPDSSATQPTAIKILGKPTRGQLLLKTSEDAGELPIAINSILPANEISNLIYRPYADEDGAPLDALIFQVMDQQGAFSTSSYVMQIYVEPSPDQPIVLPNQQLIADGDAPAGTPVGTVIASDDDNLTPFQDWKITGGNLDPDNDGIPAFAIHPETGEIIIGDPDDLALAQQPTYNLEITVSDGPSDDPNTNPSTPTPVTIIVGDIALDFDPDANPIPENTPGATLGPLQVQRSDGQPLQGFTFTTDDDRFEIRLDPTTNQPILKLRDDISLDFETEPSVTLTAIATAPGLVSPSRLTAKLTLPVLDRNEPPEAIALTSPAGGVRENDPGATIGTLSATDPDAGDTLTFTVDDDRFVVAPLLPLGDNRAELHLKPGTSLDYETEPTVTLTVTATDSGGLSTTETVTLTVYDWLEISPPDDITITPATFTLDEHAPTDPPIGTLSATSTIPDATLTDWAITGGNADRNGNGIPTFALDPITGKLTIADPDDLNYEADPTPTLTVTVSTNTGQTSAPTAIAIQLNDTFTKHTGTFTVDTLTGTATDDIFIASQGSDILTGGGGDDRFVYTRALDFGDTITDFEVGRDRIDLTQILSTLGGTPRLKAIGNDTQVQLIPPGLGVASAIDVVRLKDIKLTNSDWQNISL
jgi:hypothetical protein